MCPSESSAAIRFRPFGVSYVSYPGLVFFDLENQDLELGDPLGTMIGLNNLCNQTSCLQSRLQLSDYGKGGT